MLLMVVACAALPSADDASLLFTTLHDAYSPKSSPKLSAWPVAAVGVQLHAGLTLCQHHDNTDMFSVDLLWCQLGAARQLAANDSVTISEFVSPTPVGPLLFFMGSAERRPANIDAFFGNATSTVDEFLASLCAQPNGTWRGLGFANGLFLTFGLCDTSSLRFTLNVTRTVSDVRQHGVSDVWSNVQKSASSRFADSLWQSSAFDIAFSSLTLLDDHFVAPPADPADWSTLFNASTSLAFRDRLNSAAQELGSQAFQTDGSYWSASHAIVTKVAPMLRQLLSMNESEARTSALFKSYANQYASSLSPVDACAIDELQRFVGVLKPNASSPLVTERTRAALWNAVEATKLFICQVLLDLGGVTVGHTVIPATVATTTTTSTTATSTDAGNVTVTTTTIGANTTTTVAGTPSPTPVTWARRGAIGAAMRSVLQWVDLMRCSVNGSTGSCGINGLCQPWSLVTRDLGVTSAGCVCRPGFSGVLCDVAPTTTTTVTTATTTTTTTTTTAASSTSMTTAANVPPTPPPTTPAPTPVPAPTILNRLCPNGCSHAGLCNSITGLCTCDLAFNSSEHFRGPDCSLTPCSALPNRLCASGEICDLDGVCRTVCLLPADCGKNAVCFRADNSATSFCQCVDGWGGATCSWPVPITTTKATTTPTLTQLTTTTATPTPLTTTQPDRTLQTSTTASDPSSIGTSQTPAPTTTTAALDSGLSDDAATAWAVVGTLVALGVAAALGWWWIRKRRANRGYELLLTHMDNNADF